jgi:osmotically-inducible protein OsmY
MSETSSRIEREIEQQAGVHVAVDERGDELVVTGLVDTQGEREAALDVARALAPGKRIVDDLEVAGLLPEDISGLSLSEVAVGDFQPATQGTSDDESIEPGDFTDQEILTNPLGAAGPAATGVDEDISEGDEAYVPPTDPVRTREGEFLGGFQTTSMDSVAVPRSALDGEPGDEAIADALRRELREDAATSDLEIAVSVEDGVVRLTGSVASLDDAENAEEVAFRIDGVVDVIDELEITGLA